MRGDQETGGEARTEKHQSLFAFPQHLIQPELVIRPVRASHGS